MKRTYVTSGLDCCSSSSSNKWSFHGQAAPDSTIISPPSSTCKHHHIPTTLTGYYLKTSPVQQTLTANCYLTTYLPLFLQQFSGWTWIQQPSQLNSFTCLFQKRIHRDKWQVIYKPHALPLTKPTVSEVLTPSNGLHHAFFTLRFRSSGHMYRVTTLFQQRFSMTFAWPKSEFPWPIGTAYFFEINDTRFMNAYQNKNIFPVARQSVSK